MTQPPEPQQLPTSAPYADVPAPTSAPYPGPPASYAAAPAPSPYAATPAPSPYAAVPAPSPYAVAPAPSPYAAASASHPYAAAPVAVHYAAVPMQVVRPTSSLAVAAMVLGIVSALGGFCALGLPTIAAIILGHMGLKDTRNEVKGGRGMAITGLVLGYICLLPLAYFALSMILSLSFIGAAATAP